MDPGKEQFLTAMEAQLKDWDTRLKAFQAVPVTSKQRIEHREQEVELRMRQGSAKQYLSELRRHDEATWRPKHSGIVERWSGIREGVESMWSLIK